MKKEEISAIQKVYSNSPKLIVISINSQGKVSFINKAGCEVLGYKKKEIIGKNWFKTFLQESDRTNTSKVFRELMKGKTAKSAIHKNYILTKKEEKKLISWYNVPITDEKGNITGTFSSGLDITELANKEKEVEIFNQSFELSPTSQVLAEYINQQPVIIKVNKAFTKYYGYQEKEVIGKNPRILKNQKENHIVYKELWKDLLNINKGFWKGEIANRRKDGSTIEVILSIQTIFNEHKKPHFFVASHQDITEKKKTETLIRESEIRYKTLYMTSRDAIMLLGPPKWNFFAGNKATVKMFGCKSEKEFTSFKPPELSPKFQNDGQLSSVKSMEEIKKAMKDGFNFFEWVHQRANGKTFPATVLLTKVNLPNHSFLQATVRDITEFKKAEEEIAKRNKDLENSRIATLNMMEDLTETNIQLKELDKIKTDFLNIASHELKTPLTAISAYLEILEDMQTGMNDQQLQSLDAIKRNSNHLKTVISNILELSRIESDRFELIPAKIDVKEKTTNIIKNLKILVGRKNIELISKIDRSIKIVTDELRFEEILNNIVSNAIKFTNKGTITIRASTKDEFITISITDTGPGIPKDKISELFKDFYQVDSSISRKYGGTGLGLAITKRIVELQGGAIGVTSIQGKGSTFRFSLPLKPVITE